MMGCTVYSWTSSLIITVKTNKYGYTKAFKADSQRVALSVQVEFCVCGAMV